MCVVGVGLMALPRLMLRKTPQHDHRRLTHCNIHVVCDVNLAVIDVIDDVTHLVSWVDSDADLCQGASKGGGGVGAGVEQENNVVAVADVTMPDVKMGVLV